MISDVTLKIGMNWICAENHKWEMRTNKVIEWMNLTV